MTERRDKQKNTEKIEEAESFKAKYLRALADYQNLLKQTAAEKAEFVKYANENLLLELLPVYEHLKMSVDLSNEAGQWLEGVKYVVKQLEKILETAGIEKIETSNRPFDHNTMEAVENSETNEAEKHHTVAKELQAGYLLNGKVIVPARVAVFKAKH